jgi:hypothetical protein
MATYPYWITESRLRTDSPSDQHVYGSHGRYLRDLRKDRGRPLVSGHVQASPISTLLGRLDGALALLPAAGSTPAAVTFPNDLEPGGGLLAERVLDPAPGITEGGKVHPD